MTSQIISDRRKLELNVFVVSNIHSCDSYTQFTVIITTSMLCFHMVPVFLKGTVLQKSTWALNGLSSEKTAMLPFIWV